MITRTHFLRLIEHARQLPPLAAAFVYPCDPESLQLALSSAFAGHLAPLLVGPEARIRDIAGRAGIDLSSLPIANTEDHPRVAAARAVELARAGTVGALVKGTLGNEYLLTPVLAPESGLRGERRLSHAYFVDLPSQPQGMLLADAQLNIVPNLAAKKDIVQNTLELARAIGVATPNVAVLAAMETVSPAFASTADAVALKTMAAQGMFPGANVDGPLAADTALSPQAARANGHPSEIAGHADVLIAPTMESGLMVLRTLTGLTGGLAAGLVLGAAIPIVAPSRTDTLEVRIASCVLAVLLAAAIAEASKQRNQASSPSTTSTATLAA
jgi:phosphotransacetylase